MRSQYIIFDIVLIGVAIAISLVVISYFTPMFPNRYIINEEYYTVEALLMHRVNGEYNFERIDYDELDSSEFKLELDRMVPNDYYYLFEIPEYKFRVSNNKELGSFDKCVKLERISPIVEKFNNVHIIFAIWSKNEKMKVVQCER